MTTIDINKYPNFKPASTPSWILNPKLEDVYKIGIEKNTELISKLSIKVEYLWMLNKGISYVFQSDTNAGNKTIPSGAKVMDIESIGGASGVVDGELVTQSVEIVKLKGKNLVYTQAEKWSKNGLTNGEITNLSYRRAIKDYMPIEEDTYYTVSIPIDTRIGIHCYDENKVWLGYDSGWITNGNRFKTPANAKYYRCCWSPYKYSNADELSYNTEENFAKMLSVIQIEKGSSASAYSSYHEPQSITIPTDWAELKSAGSVYDERQFYSVEQEDGSTKYYCKYIKRVGDTVVDNQYTVLETPVVTTIELSQNLFENITVEGNGSIEFVGTNDYNMPIPNTETYLISLAEV